jgi:signal transduction histidine kinase
MRGLFPDGSSIATAEGWQLEYVKGNWTECLERLDNNEIDVMVDVAISEERLEEYAFSNESMLLSWGVIYSRPGGYVESIPELDGKRIAVMTDSIHTTGDGGILDLVDEFLLNVTIVECDNYTQVFEALESGVVDVGVVNRVFGGMYEDDYDVVRTPIIFNPTDLRFAAPLNSTLGAYLIERIDYHLIQLKRDSDSVYYQSLHTYLPNLFEEESSVPAWLMPALLISFGVLAVIVSMNLLLRHEVKVRTAELRKANEALLTETKKSDLYLDLMSHDIANIDQGIYTFAELADKESVDNPELHMYMDGILRNIQRAVALIASVRVLSSLKREPLQERLLSLNDILKDCIDEVQKSSSGEDITIAFTAPDKGAMIRAEPLVYYVFRNVLGNAVKHQRREKKRVEVDVVHRPQGGSVSVNISDYGPGIPDSMKSTLLQRWDMTHDLRLTGIGLALVKELVERYRGTVEIKDRVEGDTAKGARFVITFPIADVPERAHSRP